MKINQIYSRLICRIFVWGQVCFVLAIVLVASLLLNGSLAMAKTESTPQVVVTIKPLHSLVSGIMKDVGSPYLLLKGAASPHSFQLKPSEARLINRAELIIRVGSNLEVPLNKTFSSLSHSEKIMDMIDLKGLRLYALRGRDAPRLKVRSVEQAENGHGYGHGHNHEDDHEKTSNMNKGSMTDDDKQGTDPHLWLDFENAKVMTTAIAARLQKMDPANGPTYQKNAALMIEKLDRQIDDFEADLKPLAGRGFMVFHDAYQYLTRPYKFRFLGALRLHPSRPPSALHLKELREDMLKLKVSCVFSEPQYNNRVIKALIVNTSIRTTVLDPIGVNIAAGEDAYLLLMKQLSMQMLSCVGPS